SLLCTPAPLDSTLFPYTTLFRSRKWTGVATDLGVRTEPKLHPHFCAASCRYCEREHQSCQRCYKSDAEYSTFRNRGNARVTGLKDRKSTRLNSSHEWISYAVFCL